MLFFLSSKNLGACGDAGLVATKRCPAGGTPKLLCTNLMERRYCHETVGGNFRMDALQAAVLRAKLQDLEAWTPTKRDFFRSLRVDCRANPMPGRRWR